MSNEEKIKMLSDTDFNKCELVINRIYKEQYVKGLEQENQQLKSVLDEIREYVIKHRQIYDIDGSIEKQIDEFDVLASPKRILQILDKANNNER